LGHKHIKHGISGQNKESTAICRWAVSLFQNFNPDRFYGRIAAFVRIQLKYHTFRQALGSSYKAQLFQYATHDTGQPR
jgi:hypothetical protein